MRKATFSRRARIVLMLGAVWATAAPAQAASRTMAYFTQWGIYGADFLVKNVDTSGAAALLTHISYAFIRVAPDAARPGAPIVCQSADSWADYQKTWTAEQSIDGVPVDAGQALRGNFQQLRQLKALHPRIKVIAALGGWTNSEHFSNAALTEASRRTLAKSCVDLLLRGNLPADAESDGVGRAAGVFDGIELDWEYPTRCGNTCGPDVARPEDARNLTLLLAELRRQMALLETSSGQRFQLGVATSASEAMADTLEVRAWPALLDFVTLMSYDYHGTWETTTNFNSPLLPSPNDPSGGGSTAESVRAYLRAGVPPGLLVVGVPAYGPGWHGVGAAGHGLYQPGIGGGADGSPSLKFRQAKALLEAGFIRHEDPVTRGAWLYNAGQGAFWSYDDAAVLRHKASFVACRGLGGVALWELSGDTGDAELLAALQHRPHSCPP